MPNADSIIEERYARALSELAERQPDSRQYADELGAVVDLISTNRELAQVLINPNIKAAEKKAVLKGVFTGKVREIIINFLQVLIDKDRIKYLQGIYRQFIIHRENKNNILRMKLFLAFPLPDEQIKEICSKYRDIYGASEVKTEVEIDKSLLGGIKIQIGDKVIDDSVKSKMEGLKKFLNLQLL